jgi:hypothetical protein
MSKQAETELFGLTERDVKEFSISRAIRDMITGRKITGFEKEMHEEGMRRFPGRVLGDIFVPPDVIVGANRRDPLFRDLTVGNAGGAGGFVQTTVRPTLIEMLRKKMTCQRAGGQFLGGLHGMVKIPRQTGAATVYTLGENNLLTKSTQAVDGIAGTPHRMGCLTPFTKELFVQSSLDVENFVRNDLVKSVAVKMDEFALTGAGGVEPLGVRNTNGIGAITFGGAATWDKVVSFETAVATQNADIGRLSYITSPTVREKWKTTPKIAGYPKYLWKGSIKYPDADGEANWYQAFSTNQITDSTVCFGNFEDEIFLMWGGWDVTIDPFSLAQSATVQVVLNVFVDNIVRHAGSFAWSTDSGAQ